MELLQEDKNTHLEHLEDDIINNGYAGGQNAIAFLEALNGMLSGNSSSRVNVSVKWDGAPAIVCGPSPENGKFFVGTKSVFNKNPKVNYNIADIRKPPLSITKVADTCFECVLGKHGGYLMDTHNGEWIPIDRKGNLYTMKLWIRDASQTFGRPE